MKKWYMWISPIKINNLHLKKFIEEEWIIGLVPIFSTREDAEKATWWVLTIIDIIYNNK